MSSVTVLSPNRCHEGSRCYNIKEIYRTCFIVFLYFVACSSTRTRIPHSLHDHWRGANTEERIMKAEDSVINKMKSQSSQKTTDYLSTEHMFTSSPTEMSESSSEKTRQPLLRDVYTAYKAKQDKVHTTIETKEIQHNVSDLNERISLKNNSVVDGLEMNSGESNSQLGSLIEEKELDYNSTDKTNIDGKELIQLSSIDVNKQLKHSSSKKVKTSKNIKKGNNKRSKLNETSQNRQTDAINIRKTTDMGLTVNYLSSAETPDSLQNVEEKNRALFAVQKSTDPSTHRTHNTLDSKKYNFQGKIKSKKTEKLPNKKRKKKKKVKTSRIRNKSLNVTSKKGKKKINDISTSTEFHRVRFATNKRGKKDEYRESSKKNKTDRFANWNRLPKRVNQKQTPNAEKPQKDISFELNLFHKDRFKLRNELSTGSKENFQQDATFLPKFFFQNSRNLISTTKQIPEKKIKDRLSSVSPFRLFRYRNRKGKQHSLNEHDHFQKIVRNEGSSPDKTEKQSFPNPNPSIVTTIRNVLKPGKGKESAQQNISDNFEVSKLFRTTQSESTLKSRSDRFKQNKQSYVTMLPLTTTLDEKNLERTVIVPKNVKELSETDVKQTDLNEKESRHTNNVKHKEVTEYLKLTSLPSKTSAGLNDHLLNKVSSAPNFISTADHRHLSFENTIIKQTVKGSVTDLDANLKRNSSIQFNNSAPFNSDFIDEVQTTHENFSSKSSTDQVVISELSTNPTILSSGKGSSLRTLYGNTKTKMKKSKIPETELIYQTVTPKYLWQNTAQSKTNREQIASQNDIHFNDLIKLLSTQIPHDMLTKLPTPKSENYKSEDNVAASSGRSNEESKSSVTVNYIDDSTQTSISKVSDDISLKNEHKYNSYSINPTHGSYKHLSTSATPKELFHFPLDFDNSTPSKSIADEKHRTSQIFSTTTKDPKTSEHTILTTKYDTSVSTSELPTYSQDASVSTIMTNSQYKASSSHITPTHQPLFQTTMIPTLRISPITRVVSTENLSTKAAKIFQPTFPKLHSKIIVEQTSATTDKMPTSHQKSINNGNISNHISSTLYLQPLSTRRTQLSSTQHPPYITEKISKRHTTPQTTNTSSRRTPSLATTSSTRNRPHLPTTLPKQHTSSLTRKMILPPSTISTRNTKSHTIKLSSRTKMITTSKFSNPHILSRSFSKPFITTIVTSKTHKPSGSIQSEATPKNALYDFTSMTQTTKHISKDNRVPTTNTPSSNSVTPSPESVSTPSQETGSTWSQTFDKGHQNLLVVCKVDTSVNINSDQFQNNIRNGLVQSYIEGKALGEVNKSGSMKKRRKRSLEGSKDQVHRINEMTLTKCADGCKTGSDDVKAVIIRQDRRDALVSIYFQMQENGSVVEAEKAAEIFARLQLTEISVHLKYAIFEKVTVIKSLLPRQGHPPKPSSTKWMMVTIAAPSIPVLCVIFILLSSWYRNHTRLRQKAMADISRGSGYTESLADVGLEIDMEKGEIVSRAGSTSVLWSEDFVASATKETNSHAGYFGADYESSRSNSWSAYADPNNVFNSLRNKKRSPIPKRYQRQGKYAKKHSSSSFNFETGLEDEWLGCLLSTDYCDAGNFKAEWLQLQSFRRCSLGANEHNTTAHQFMNPLNRFWVDTSGPILQQCSPTSPVAGWPKNNNGKTIHPRVKHAVKLPVGPKC
ncbi:uncharacterized protein LOC115211655 isoform X2 [Octopus sinensis]|uniref:Uncharacterized protein LOC115211655 isoform X2 n=1 Tax=Octopus sinensis TaxID=2607531 RepID=A0A7E6EWT8_9MOLL|nr:uncharacterized protein LOC115211655 isoform X2 [Octopus sinensis]